MCLLGRDMESIGYEATSADPNAGVKTAKPVPPELLAARAADAAATADDTAAMAAAYASWQAAAAAAMAAGTPLPSFREFYSPPPPPAAAADADVIVASRDTVLKEPTIASSTVTAAPEPAPPPAEQIAAITAATTAPQPTEKSLIQMIGYQRNIYSLNRMTDSIRESIDELRGSTASNSTDSSIKLSEDYGIFLSNLRAYIAAASISTTDSTRMNTDMIDFRRRYSVLEDRKSSLVGSTNTFSTASNAFRYYIDFIVFIGGPITAILLIMNMYATKNIAYKLLFSVFGALWYPLTLLFSAVFPQPWNIVFDRSFFYGSSVTSFSHSVESHERSKLMLRVLSGVMFVLWATAAILLIA
jgi:hypothetical protein